MIGEECRFPLHVHHRKQLNLRIYTFVEFPNSGPRKNWKIILLLVEKLSQVVFLQIRIQVERERENSAVLVQL